jgi:predicted RNA-binding protein with PUA-like domain
MTQYWLVKSNPACFSIDDLRTAPKQTTPWDGVRNYEARNYIRDQMAIGDQVFFYHSKCSPPGIIGICEVVSKAYPDYTAFDPNSQHPDAGSSPENPRWFMVDVHFKEKFKELIPLTQLKRYTKLKNMRLLRQGNRVSVLPVSKEEWLFINQELVL